MHDHVFAYDPASDSERRLGPRCALLRSVGSPCPEGQVILLAAETVNHKEIMRQNALNCQDSTKQAVL